MIFHDHHAVYTHFRQWNEMEWYKPFDNEKYLWEEILQEPVVRERVNNNRNKKATWLADAQSLKNSDTAGLKGYNMEKIHQE